MKTKKADKERKGRAPTQTGRPAVVVVACLLLCAISTLVMGLEFAPPERYLQAGDTVSQDIVTDDYILDEEETRRQKSEAEAAVSPVYTENEEAYRSVQIRNERFFTAMDSLRTEADVLRRQNIQAAERNSELRQLEEGTLTADEWDLVLGDAGHEQLGMTYGEWLDRGEMNRMLALQQTTYNTWLRVLTLQSNALMRKGVAEGEEETVREEFIASLRNQTPLSIQSVLTKLADFLVQPTMFLDEALTEQSRQIAQERVLPVYIEPDTVIASKGSVLSQESYQLLSEIDYVLSLPQFVGRWMGVAFLHISIALVVGRMMLGDRRNTLRSWREGIMLVSLALLTLGLGKLMMPGEYHANPILLGVILVTQLLSPSAGILFLMVQLPALTTMGVGGSSIDYALMCENLFSTLFGGLVVAVLTDKTSKRSRVLQASVAGGFMMIIVNGLFAMLQSVDTVAFLWSVTYVFGFSLLSGVLAIGLLPLWELVFSVASPTSFVELGDINHPLLKQLMIEAPGTYNHSLMVATLSEAVADALDANANLVKVAAYFHDVGKLKRPMFFSENQKGFNPHDELDPVISSAIITAHVTDGLEIAKKHRLPGKVCDLITQHHGDSMAAAFYYKAVEQYGRENVKQEDFRYKSPKPQSKEAAILMICDSIEAAVRSIDNPRQEDVDRMIDSVISGKINDGQLGDCDMRLSELELLKETVRASYDGILHERVKYPDVETLRSELNIPTLPEKKEEQSSGD